MKHDQKADEAVIRGLIDKWRHAVEEKDLDGVVEAYTPQTVLYDVTAPVIGKEAIRAVWERCFPYFPDKFRSEHQDLHIEIDGDIAFVHAFHQFFPEPADHPCGQFKMRVTTGMRRIGGEWRVLHEHVSIPFQMEGQAECGAGEAASQPAPEFSAAAKAASHGVHRLSPYLICAGAAKAIDFYKEAFGAEELMRLEIEPGRIMHACLKINGSSVMLGEENAEMGAKSPTTLKATPVTMHLIVDDADRFAARAVEAGAKIVMPVADMFWGDRYGIVEDPFGHRWAVATPKKPIFGKELEEAAKAAVAAHKRARASQQAQA